MEHLKKAAAAAPSLPDDALVEILSCLPAKSLCRFKCLSKAWRDLISDRLHCNKLPQTLAGFFVLDKEEEEIHGGDSDNGRDASSDRSICGRFINTLGRFVPLASLSFVEKMPGIQELGLLHSCNGLILYGHRRVSDTYHSLGYIVCNPTTEQWVSVPRAIWEPYSTYQIDEDTDSDNELNLDKDTYHFTYLIFDPAVSSHFQLIQYIQFMPGRKCDVCVEHVYAYSSQTGVWRETTDEWSSAEQVGVSVYAGSAILNGMLHLSATHSAMGQEIIIAVDGEGKEQKIIRGPEKSADVVFVGQSQGHLHYMTQHRDNTRKMTEMSIWVLQDYDQEEWVLKHSVTFLQLFGKMNCQCEFDVVAIHPDHNLIFFVQLWDLKLKSYDMDTKEVCVLYTLRFPHYIFPYVPYFVESPALANKHRNCTF